MEKQRCTALTSAGRPCQAWAVRGSDPPRCAAHSSVDPAGELTGEALEEEIDAVRRLLWRLRDQLNDDPDLSVQEMAVIAPMMLDAARTMAHLLRDQRALRGDTVEGIAGAIGRALDELAVEWGLNE